MLAWIIQNDSSSWCNPAARRQAQVGSVQLLSHGYNGIFREQILNQVSWGDGQYTRKLRPLKLKIGSNFWPKFFIVRHFYFELLRQTKCLVQCTNKMRFLYSTVDCLFMKHFPIWWNSDTRQKAPYLLFTHSHAVSKASYIREHSLFSAYTTNVDQRYYCTQACIVRLAECMTFM